MTIQSMDDLAAAVANTAYHGTILLDFINSVMSTVEIVSAEAAGVIGPEHQGKIIHLTDATPAWTLSVGEFPVGFSCFLYGDATFTLTAAAEVEINGVAASEWTAAVRPGSVRLICVGENEWTLLGNATDTTV